MLKRPRARDVMADIFPHDTNNWLEALKHWSPRLAGPGGARAISMGRNASGLALWLAMQGIEVHVFFDPLDFEIFSIHQVEEQIHELEESAGNSAYDIVCLTSTNEDKSQLTKDLDEAEQYLKDGGLLLLGISGKLARSSAYKAIDGLSAFQEVEGKNYALLSTKSKIKYFRHFAVLINKLFQNMTPASWKYQRYITARK